ncbi:MAG TPA: CHAT domain-containing tetratricopeptide repeat protein [Chitinophagaceae bacterium]|nr:CHAT domain-containing tetratricopeptide repeat protein [Chitinophagaceae bacterium]
MKINQEAILFFLLFLSYEVCGQTWKDQADSAKVFQDQKNNAKAIEYYQKANDLLKNDSAFTASYQRNSNHIGDLYVATGQYSKAEPFYLEAKQVIEKLEGKENADYAASCNNLGRVYRLMGQYEKSEVLLIEAKNLREKILGKENADYATTCNNLAVLYFEVGQYETARPFYVEAKEIREKVLGKEHIDYAASVNNLGILAMVTGRPDEAESLYLEAKRIREKVLGKEHPFYAASCNNLGALYLETGQYRKAEPLYLEAKQIREKTLGKQHPEYAASCNNLAILYMDIGNYDQAELLYAESLQIGEKVLGTKHPEYAKSCINLALLYRTLGQYDKAEPLFIQARQVLGEVLGREHPEYAKSCNNLGALYMVMGDFDRAAPLYDEARQIWKKVLGNEHPEYAKSCNNLALIYWNGGEYEKAEPLFLETNQIREKVFGKAHPDYAEGCDNLGVLYADMGNYSDALALHLLARQIRETVLGKEHAKYVESCLNLANVYWKMGEFAQANKYYTDAFNLQQAQTKKVFAFTTEPEKQSYIKKINEFRNLFLSYTLADVDPQPTTAYAVSLASRNLILFSSQQLRQSIYNTNNTALINKYDNWVSTREQLAFWYSRPLIDKKDQIKSLEEKANMLEKELTRSSEQFRKGQQQITWQKIQQSLKENEVAIEFVEFQSINGKRSFDSTYYVALVLRKDKPAPQMVQLFEKKQIDELLKKGGSWSAIDSLYTSPALYKLVWQPLEKYLVNISKVYYASAGVLHKINLAAVNPDKRIVLGEQYQLVHLNTTASIPDQEDIFINPSDRLLMYGGINFNADSSELKTAAKPYQLNNENSIALRGFNLTADRLPDLPYTEEEVDYITKFARKKKYLIKTLKGVEANEESVKALKGKNSPAVLHMATHGKFFPDPVNINPAKSQSGGKAFAQSDNPLLRSMLLLAGANNAWSGKSVAGVQDGVLTAYEISNLYLPNTKLVVLSACETGLGDIQGSEGVYGLQRSFKMAGVKNLIMSLWSVPDNTTAEFMQVFYDHLLQKKSVNDAFNLTQKIMRDKYNTNPHKWAGIVLIQ